MKKHAFLSDSRELEKKRKRKGERERGREGGRVRERERDGYTNSAARKREK